jgi:hypothetical protein
MTNVLPTVIVHAGFSARMTRRSPFGDNVCAPYLSSISRWLATDNLDDGTTLTAATVPGVATRAGPTPMMPRILPFPQKPVGPRDLRS